MDLKRIGGLAVSWMSGAVLGLACAAGQAETRKAWPERPVKLVVPYSAGGVVDVLGRMLAKSLEEDLGVPVVVENLTGAGGTIGAAAVARAQPDGHTLLVGATGPISVAKVLFPNLPYDPERDFRPIAMLGISPFVVVTNQSTGWTSVQDLVEASRRKPGTVSYGSAGNGTPQHIIGEMFKQATGASITHIPYRGSIPAIQDLIGGQIGLMFDNPVNLVSHIRSGNLVALAQTGSSRLPILPDVPTVAQAGAPGFDATPWYGLLAPRDVPPGIAQHLNERANAFLGRPEVVDKLASLGMSVQRMPLEELAAFLEQEGRKWSAAASAARAPAN